MFESFGARKTVTPQPTLTQIANHTVRTPGTTVA